MKQKRLVLVRLHFFTQLRVNLFVCLFVVFCFFCFVCLSGKVYQKKPIAVDCPQSSCFFNLLCWFDICLFVCLLVGWLVGWLVCLLVCLRLFCLPKQFLAQEARTTSAWQKQHSLLASVSMDQINSVRSQCLNHLQNKLKNTQAFRGQLSHQLINVSTYC